MRAIVIAVCMVNNRLIGVRLLRLLDNEIDDLNLKAKPEVVDTSIANIVNAMKNNVIDVVNVKLNGDKLDGRGAKLSRYAQLNVDGSLKNKAPLVILKSIKSDGRVIGYIISDHRGQLKKVSLEDAIKYADVIGIANGKLVTKNNNTFISNILGEYEAVEIKQSKQDNLVVGHAEWEVDEFKKFMREHKFKYRYANNTLYYLDERINDFYVPKGMKSINSFIKKSADETVESGLHTLHYSPSSTSLEDDLITSTPSIKRVEPLIYDGVELVIDYAVRVADVEIIRNSTYSVLHGYMSDSRCENKKEADLEFIIPEVRSITNSYSGVIVNGDLDLSGITSIKSSFNSCIINGIIRIPKSVSILTNSFNNMVCKGIIFEDGSNLQRLSSSFGNVSGESHIRINGTQELTVYCAFIASSDITDVEIYSKEYVEISGSFNRCENLSRIKLGETTQHIICSFTSCKALNEVDLSGCSHLIEICNSFNECTNLKYFKLPISDVGIGLARGVADAYKIESYELPENISYLDGIPFNKDSLKRITVHNPKTSLRGIKSSDLLIEFNMDKVECRTLQSSSIGIIDLSAVKSIGAGFMQSNKVCDNIILGKDLHRVEQGAFQAAISEIVLDMSMCTELKCIENDTFSGSSFKGILLPDGIKSIGEHAFKNCNELKFLYIPASVEAFGKYWLHGAGSRCGNGTTFYIHENSHADKVLTRTGDRNIIYVNSVEEVVDKELNVTDKVLQAKLRMLVGSDPIHGELMSNEYSDRAREYIGIYNACTASCVRANIELDTDKLPSKKYDYLSDELKRAVANKNNNISENNFNLEVNLILNTATDYTSLLDEVDFDRAYAVGKLRVDAITNIRKCRDKAIITFSYRLNGIEFKIKMIILGQEVAYFTAFNSTNAYSSYSYMPEFNDESNVPGALEFKLVKNTLYPLSIYAIENVPRYIINCLRNGIDNQWSRLLFYNIEKSANNKLLNTSDALFYSRLTGNIIHTQCIGDGSASSNHLTYIRYLKVLDVYDVKSLDTNIKAIINEKIFNNGSVEVMLKNLLYGNEEMFKSLSTSQEAFNKPVPCNEWLLSMKLKQNNVFRVEDLTYELACEIFGTKFFTRVNKRKKLEDANIGSIDIANSTTTIYYDALKKVIELDTIYGGSAKYLSSIGDGNGKNAYYVSKYTFKQVFDIIIRMYDPNAKYHDTIDDTIVNKSDFSLVETCACFPCSSNWQKYYLRQGIYINKASGIPFLITELEKGDISLGAHKFFALKDLGASFKMINLTETGYHQKIEDFDITGAAYMVSIVEMNLNNIHHGATQSDFEYIRGLILKGCPNGYTEPGLNGYLLKLINKQPR